jgi:hypothetical protein
LNGSVDVVFKDVKVATQAQIGPASFGKYSTIWSRSTYKVDAGSRDLTKESLRGSAWNVVDKSCATACHNSIPATWNSRLSCVGCHSQL